MAHDSIPATATASDPWAGNTSSGWLKCAVVLLAIVAVGLPINDVGAYALLVVVAIVVFTGKVRTSIRGWLAAVAVVIVAVVGQLWLAPPRFDEGHNLFLPGGPTQALKRGLPADVYDRMASEFDKQYPQGVRCKPPEVGCWLGMGFPDGTFAFSADGIFSRSEFSRSVTRISFADPVWLRLGFINEYRYNWYTANPDLQRASRDRRPWMGLHRWHLTMPWFEMIRFPAAYVGSKLCWRGEVMWEGADQHFTLLPGERCRVVEPTDVGRRIVGLAIIPDTLAMHLTPPWSVRFLQIAAGAVVVGTLVALLLILVSVTARALIFPIVLVGLSVAAIAILDASFLGGARPFDGGDDGLFYDGVGRSILQALLKGDYETFLIGAERVFYYGGPGLRYFRALEHIVFGETFLGYLSLVLAMPFVVYGLFRRFLTKRWAVVLGVAFVAVPVGKYFGTTFGNYVEWAERGFADPAAYILAMAGILTVVGINRLDREERALQSDGRFAPALCGALLLALGIIMKPLIAPAIAVFLIGAGIAAVYWRQWHRLLGLCIGILPVFSMALHNWVFGHVFVLFSTNAAHPLVLNMPPAAYLDALRELFSLDFSGGQFLRALKKVPEWLSSGPYESSRLVPVNAMGVAILFYVVVRGRKFDPWLRLIGAAALAQHGVALFYVPTARYHYLTWFLTALVTLVFAQRVGAVWLRRRLAKLSVKTGQSHQPTRGKIWSRHDA